jgi:hypothetical protein
MSFGHNAANCDFCHALGPNQGRFLYACTRLVPPGTFPAYDGHYVTLYVADAGGGTLEYDFAAHVDCSAQLVEAKRRAIARGWVQAQSANNSNIQCDVNIAIGDALERLTWR